MEEDDEEYTFRVFFRKEEIKMAKELQSRDQFDDVISLRMDATAEAAVNYGSKINRINILDFTPREKKEEDVTKKKKKSKTKKVVLGIEEEEEDDNYEEQLEEYEKKKKE